MTHGVPTWPPSETRAFLAVRNQAPLSSYTNAFELSNMLHLTPSATTDRAATVKPGDPGPDFRLVSSDRRTVTHDSFRGKPLVMRLTRAVAERVV